MIGRFFMSVLMALVMGLVLLFTYGMLKGLLMSHYHWMFPV